MNITELPQEVINRIVKSADLTPLQLIQLGKRLTKRQNKLSAAALDDESWRKWSRPGLNACKPDLPLCEAFQERWHLKHPSCQKSLRSLYKACDQGRAYPLRDVPQSTDDVDIQIVKSELALTQGRYENFEQNVSFNERFYDPLRYENFDQNLFLDVLYEPRIAYHLLSNPAWLKRSNPHTILTLQQYCVTVGMPIPPQSLSNAIWEKFIPEADAIAVGDGSMHDRAKERWYSKTPEVRAAIGRMSQTKRPIASYESKVAHKHYYADFESVFAVCNFNGGCIEDAEPVLRDDRHLALLAMNNDGGMSYKSLSLRLRDDDDVATAAMRWYGRALEFASQRLRSKDSIIRVACSADGSAISFADESVLQNTDRILDFFDAVQDKFTFYGYLPQDMQQDPQIYAAMIYYKDTGWFNGGIDWHTTAMRQPEALAQRPGRARRLLNFWRR